MKTNHIVCFYLLLILFIVSCRKKDPQPANPSPTSSPVFSFSGDINGVPVSIKAGINDYLISSSYLLNQNGVYEFNTVFMDANCMSDCPNSLKISIKDYRKSATQPTTIDSAIVTGNYLFAMPSGIPSQFNQTFIGGLISKNAKSFSWNFGDNSPVVTTTGSTIIHNYRHIGVYAVTLNVLDSTGQCSSTIGNNIKIGQLDNSLVAYYYPSNVIGDSVLFTALPKGGTAPYSYLWDFGDGTFSNSANPIHTYSSGGTYSTSLSITDAAGNTDLQRAYVAIQQSSVCASFLHPVTLTSTSDSLNLSGVIIEWVDANGTKWTSNNDKQSSESSVFKIISVEDYMNNANGNPTKKIQTEFSCTLYNGSNRIYIKNAKATVAITYKK
jgi:PKD repeat protein